MARNSRSRLERLLAAAEGYRDLGLFEHALTALDEIPESDQTRFAVHALRGDILKNLERYDEALLSLKSALEEKPEDVPLLLSMAWCYKRTRQLAKAIESTEQAYRCSPSNPLILYNLGCYWALAGNKTQALSWLGRALRMDKSLRGLVSAEHDFDSIRTDPDFQLIVGSPHPPE